MASYTWAQQYWPTRPPKKTYIYKLCTNRLVVGWVECSSMVWETWVQFQVVWYQRLLKWYLIPPCLTLSNVRYVLRVKWSNPGKGVAPSPTPQCSSYRKGSFRVTLDDGRQLYLLTDTLFRQENLQRARSNELRERGVKIMLSERPICTDSLIFTGSPIMTTFLLPFANPKTKSPVLWLFSLYKVSTPTSHQGIFLLFLSFTHASISNWKILLSQTCLSISLFKHN